jgi:predicted HicB family RNase H-like nuclease
MEYKGERERLTVRVPVATSRKLTKLAKAKGVSVNELIVRYLEQQLGR